ncbi:hypothetical protein C5612_02260 [Pseudomonas frederiksbergensis]|uniref:Uncharacterized protein n=1 Tax=Pseudomonas frederiksbergensis TaxID=104087 RepID=A0A2S8HWV9_9PSED|nr:hypothetical protein C5612_02260 [Pseudomonas frederiksbergensis]
MGAGLLAKAECQSISSLPDTPLSRASPLPQGGFADTGVTCRRQRWPRPADPGASHRSRQRSPGPS